MLRMGRNLKADQQFSEHAPDQPAHFNPGPGHVSPSSNGGGIEAHRPTAPVASAPAPRAITESESLARDIKEGILSGFVGNGTVVTGEAVFRGMLRVDGHLTGRISSPEGTLIVSTNGRVDADVNVAVAQIFGTVNGDITASKRIEMGRVSKVTGNIETSGLVVENGAVFEGTCRMVQAKEAQVQVKDGAEKSAIATPRQIETPSELDEVLEAEGVSDEWEVAS